MDDPEFVNLRNNYYALKLDYQDQALELAKLRRSHKEARFSEARMIELWNIEHTTLIECQRQLNYTLGLLEVERRAHAMTIHELVQTRQH